MPRGSARIALLLAVLTAGIAGGVSTLGAPAATPGVPSIYITYNPDCSFSMTADGGFSMTSGTPPGPTLPPGTYSLEILMENPSSGYTCTTPIFTLTGPGVNNRTVFPMQAVLNEVTVTLQPSSTYTGSDASAPAATQRVFSTSASGSNSVLLGQGGTTVPKAGSTEPDIVGSGLAPFRGKLVATVSPAGKPTLATGGHSVASLEAGRYDIAVADHDKRAGFFVQRTSRKTAPVTVTGLAFTGERTRVVTLTAGTWTFFSSVGKPTRFAVVS